MTEARPEPRTSGEPLRPATSGRVALAPPPARIDPRRPTPADWAYARAVLPRVSRTFAINIRLLSGAVGDAVRVAYLMCRIADTLEDDWGGRRADVEHRFDLLLAAIEGDVHAAEALAQVASRRRTPPASAAEAEHASLVARTPAVWRCFTGLEPADRKVVAEGVSVMARGMRRYAGRHAAALETAPASSGAPLHPWIVDESELGEYCWIVAGCVGVMLTGLVSRRSPTSPSMQVQRLTLAPAVGEGLQLTNILLDWPRDVRRGRCYLPAAWLAEESITAEQLVGAASPAVTRIVDRLEQRAREALSVVPDYLDTWPASQVRYRQFCLWPALWAKASLDAARRDPQFPWSERRPRIPRTTLWRTALAAVVWGHGDAGVRRLFRDVRSGSDASDPERRTAP